MSKTEVRWSVRYVIPLGVPFTQPSEFIRIQPGITVVFQLFSSLERAREYAEEIRSLGFRLLNIEETTTVTTTRGVVP